jgi:signal transduction histidine kinase
MSGPSGDPFQQLHAQVEELEQKLTARDETIDALLRRVEAQKLEAIGQLLAAGIAHEVNTPAQYVADNVSFLQRAFDKLSRLIEAQGQLVEAVRSGDVTAQMLDNVDAARTAAKLDYLTRQVPRAIQQSLEGLGQVSSIVKAMKEFSHPSGAEKQPFDIHDLIESTTIVAKNEWKYVAELQLDFDWSLPAVLLLRSEFSQVMLNLIVNAAHAIAASLPPASADKGQIVISTRAVGRNVEVRVSDNGTSNPEAGRARVFEPLLHGGSIHFETEQGRGTTFVVTLPLALP